MMTKNKKGQFEIQNKIQFRALQQYEVDEMTGKEIDQEKENMVDDEFWCLPFSVDDLEDF